MDNTPSGMKERTSDAHSPMGNLKVVCNSVYQNSMSTAKKRLGIPTGIQGFALLYVVKSFCLEMRALEDSAQVCKCDESILEFCQKRFLVASQKKPGYYSKVDE